MKAPEVYPVVGGSSFGKTFEQVVSWARGGRTGAIAEGVFRDLVVIQRWEAHNP
jgi:hypothetical protein